MINTISKLWPRIGAFILDTIFLGIIGQLLGLVAYDFLAGLGHESILVGLVISMIYFTIGYSPITNGQTIGKKILSIKVVNINNSPLNFQMALLRALVLTVPYFLVNYPIPFMPADSPLNFYKSLILLILLICLVFFVFFNKSTRQSFHDLLAGSYVVDVNPDTIKSNPKLDLKTVQVFYGIMGFIFVLSLLFMKPNNKDKTNPKLAHLEKVRIELDKLPGVLMSSASDNTTTFISENRKVTRSLVLALKTEFKPDFNDLESKELIDKSVDLAFEYYDSISKIDNIRIKLYHGFSIGISKWNTSINDVRSTFEILYPDSINTEMISQPNFTNVSNKLPEDKKKVIQTHHKNGKLASESTYFNKKPIGTSRSWFENGNLESSIEYKDGKRHGLTTTYFENGQKESELLYENNNLKKVISRFDEKGNKLSIVN